MARDDDDPDVDEDRRDPGDRQRNRRDPVAQRGQPESLHSWKR